MNRILNIHAFCLQLLIPIHTVATDIRTGATSIRTMATNIRTTIRRSNTITIMITITITITSTTSSRRRSTKWPTASPRSSPTLSRPRRRRRRYSRTTWTRPVCYVGAVREPFLDSRKYQAPTEFSSDSAQLRSLGKLEDLAIPLLRGLFSQAFLLSFSEIRKWDIEMRKSVKLIFYCVDLRVTNRTDESGCFLMRQETREHRYATFDKMYLSSLFRLKTTCRRENFTNFLRFRWLPRQEEFHAQVAIGKRHSRDILYLCTS